MGTGDGVEHVAAEKVLDNALYNLAGQRVSDSYKGLVVKKGKKVIMQ